MPVIFLHVCIISNACDEMQGWVVVFIHGLHVEKSRVPSTDKLWQISPIVERRIGHGRTILAMKWKWHDVLHTTRWNQLDFLRIDNQEPEAVRFKSSPHFSSVAGNLSEKHVFQVSGPRLLVVSNMTGGICSSIHLLVMNKCLGTWDRLKFWQGELWIMLCGEHL